MANDKGFSRIISAVVVIVIIILIGVVISINSTDDGVNMDLVDIVENNIDNESVGNVETSNAVAQFMGLDMTAGGYRVTDQNSDNEVNIIIEITDQQYTLLTASINKDKVFLIKDFWQDKENGAKELFELELSTGKIEELFSLPNLKVDNKRKFITGAVYSIDEQKIVYITQLYDEERSELSKVSAEGVEVWEYDINKDIHTLITNVSGGLYSGLKVLGYDELQENIVLYQYNADAGASVLGKVQFLNIADGVVDNSSFQLALDNYFSQVDEEIKIKTAGYPYLSPSGEFIAFILPSQAYKDEVRKDSREVVLYNTATHSIKSIFIENETSDEYNYGFILSNLYWVDNYLYIPTPTKLVMYSIEADKIISIYAWSEEYKVDKLYSVTEDSVLIGVGTSNVPLYVDFSKATERELSTMENFEYINIYYK